VQECALERRGPSVRPSARLSKPTGVANETATDLVSLFTALKGVPDGTYAPGAIASQKGTRGVGKGEHIINVADYGSGWGCHVHHCGSCSGRVCRSSGAELGTGQIVTNVTGRTRCTARVPLIGLVPDPPTIQMATTANGADNTILCGPSGGPIIMEAVAA
jgi:hypothetical protein